MKTVARTEEVRWVRRLLREAPVVALLGARQVGKSTLARRVASSWKGPTRFLDLEDPDDRTLLAEPKAFLAGLRGLVVLDEVQNAPELFRVLRVLADRPGTPARFLVLGSASPDLLRQTSETLAGRIAFHDLSPFALDEIGVAAAERLWLRGGFPPSFLAPNDGASARWRRAYTRTFLERDLPQLGVEIPAATLRRFWAMLAHCHGQVLNSSELGRSFGVAHTTVRRWLDVLCATFVVRLLAPWHENLAKRQVKSPKVYVSDTGILHSLLDLEGLDAVLSHPKCGYSWESFAMDAVVRRLGVRREQCYFWATHASADLDLLVVAGGRRMGFEFKRTTAPQATSSMRIAMADLGLEELTVVHAGEHSFPMGNGIRATALKGLAEELKSLRSAGTAGGGRSRGEPPP